MLFIFSMPVSIRHLWQHKTVVFLHWCLIRAVLMPTVKLFTTLAFSFERRQRKPLLSVQADQERAQRPRRQRRSPQAEHHPRPAGAKPSGRGVARPVSVQPVPQPLQRITRRIARIVPRSVQSDARSGGPAQPAAGVGLRKFGRRRNRKWRFGGDGRTDAAPAEVLAVREYQRVTVSLNFSSSPTVIS